MKTGDIHFIAFGPYVKGGVCGREQCCVYDLHRHLAVVPLSETSLYVERHHVDSTQLIIRNLYLFLYQIVVASAASLTVDSGVFHYRYMIVHHIFFLGLFEILLHKSELRECDREKKRLRNGKGSCMQHYQFEVLFETYLDSSSHERHLW